MEIVWSLNVGLTVVYYTLIRANGDDEVNSLWGGSTRVVLSSWITLPTFAVVCLKYLKWLREISTGQPFTALIFTAKAVCPTTASSYPCRGQIVDNKIVTLLGLKVGQFRWCLSLEKWQPGVGPIQPYFSCKAIFTMSNSNYCFIISNVWSWSSFCTTIRIYSIFAPYTISREFLKRLIYRL